MGILAIKNNCGKIITVLAQQTVAAVGDMLHNNLSGNRCQRNGLGPSVSLFHCIVKKDLWWHPYPLKDKA